MLTLHSHRLPAFFPMTCGSSRASDEPEHVRLKLHEFIDCLIEAIIIVVVVAVLFMEWRSALIVALSIPITLAMTLGMCAAMGIDLQQVSIAAPVIALGLLVDDPVVAGDAINRELPTARRATWPHGWVRRSLPAPSCTRRSPIAWRFCRCSWCSRVTGEFIYSLPIVVTASLVASRIVSMTFVRFSASTCFAASLASRPD